MRLFHRLAASGLVLLAFACISPAHAQRTPVFQSGALGASGNIAKFYSNGLIGDGAGLLGDVNARGLTPFAITDGSAAVPSVPGLGLCFNSTLTSVAHNALCFGHDASGNGFITLDSYGGMVEKTLFLRKNGTQYELPFAVGGIVGPSPTVVGDLAVWNSGDGTLLRGGLTGFAAAGTLSGNTNVPFRDYGTLTIVDTATNTNVSAPGAPKIDGFRVNHQFGAGEGNRNAIFSVLNQTASTPIGGFTSFFTSNFAWTRVDVASSGGNYYAYGGLTEQISGTGTAIKAAEFDTSIQAGASASYHVTLTLDLVNSHASRGTGFDAAMSIAADTSVSAFAKYKNGIVFGDPLGYWAFAQDSTLIGTNTGLSGSPAREAAWGVDFLDVTFSVSGGAFRSIGFLVQPSGITEIKPATTGSAASLIVRGGTAASEPGAIINMGNTAPGVPTPNKWLRVSGTGAFEILNSVYTNSIFAVNDGGAVLLTKKVAGGVAPGVPGVQLEIVCGTGAGTAKIIATAGTSATPVTVSDNIGAGVTGC